MAEVTILTSDLDNSEVYCYGAYAVRQGAIVDESSNFVVDENGNKVIGFAIIEEE